jgi:hypothetical protein
VQLHVRIRTTTLLACAALAIAPAAAAAQSDAPGDSYLNAVRLNPGSSSKPAPLPVAGASFSADTTSFGTQGDLLNPPGSGGTAEPNTCARTPYGRTAWAWLFTRRWAQAEVRANGVFDSVLAVMPFTSPSNPRLSIRGGVCVNRSASGQEDFGTDQPILAPGWYAIQVGGVSDTGGQVSVSVALHEPPRVTAKVRATARRATGGAAVTLRVNAPKGARLAFACARRTCRLPAGRTVARAALQTYLRGRVIPNGARLELRVTRAGHIGTYFAWDVRDGRLGKVSTRCTEPASTRPRSVCDG